MRQVSLNSLLNSAHKTLKKQTLGPEHYPAKPKSKMLTWKVGKNYKWADTVFWLCVVVLLFAAPLHARILNNRCINTLTTGSDYIRVLFFIVICVHNKHQFLNVVKIKRGIN